MPLPAWMNGYPGAPKTGLPDWVKERMTSDVDNEQTGLTACNCRGEGCATCDGDGVIYP